jgi:ornithine cyclodeaminase
MMLLNAEHLRATLDMPTCIAAMERVFVDLANGAYFNPLRMRIRQDEASPSSMTLMPSMRHRGTRRWALKQMVVCPDNRKLGLDPLQGSVLLHDGDTGRLLAVADAPALTAIRTAAVSALAARTLANPDPAVVTLVGVGIQARAHVDAMRAVFPKARLRTWGRTPAKAQAFAEANGLELAASLEAAVREADVLCTLTSSSTPFVRREWIRPGCHINAVGSSKPVHVELFPETVAAASLFVDGRQAALEEAGDIVAALKAGAITAAHVQAELGEVLAGRHPGRRSREEFTLYKSLGNGAQDLAAIEAAIEAARRLGQGFELDW